MFELDSPISLTERTILSPNLTPRFSEEDLAKIGTYVYEGYKRDRASRYKWEKRTQEALDLAMQVQKEKSFPWPGCSNIAFPLITIAALQFHSRAYPAIIQGADVVRCRVIGEDDAGQKTARAKRIAVHMSWQCLEEDSSWEEQKDRQLINLPIVGTNFIKSYYDADKGHRVSEFVPAQDLVVDYWAKSLETCPRKTHIIPLFRNQILSYIARGIYENVKEEAWMQEPPALDQGDQEKIKSDNRLGTTPVETDETTPYTCLEQHVDLDLDGDGYAEPWIITIEETTQCVLRIVTGYDRPQDIERNLRGEVIQIHRTEYFTKYELIPSPDGGMYGVGFGVLLGPLNESTNSLINQLVDAGTMSITAGGFLGRGAKMRGGQYTFSPFQWQRVDSTGDDLTKSMVPLPVREPNAVLFQLLSLLINYVERISGTTDPMVGENPGQNTTAETMRTMVQEGQRVYTAVFKRVWRSMKQEFRKGYILNGVYMPFKKSFGGGQVILREDYLGNPDEVAPSADPNISSEGMQMQQIQMLKASAAQTPGYNQGAVERRFLKAMKIDNVDEIYPGVEKTGQPEDPKLVIEKLKQQTKQMQLQMQQQQWVAEMQQQVRMDEVEIIRIMAEIEDMRSTTQGDAQDRQIGAMNAMVGMMKNRNDATLKRIDVVLKQMDVEIKELEIEHERAKGNTGGGDAGGLAKPSGKRAPTLRIAVSQAEAA